MKSRIWWSMSLAFSALVVAGCTTAATRVTIEPSPTRAEAEVRSDATRCAQTSVTASAETTRNREYAACLLAPGVR